MKNDPTTRFEIKLQPERRRQLDELASATGISATDLCPLAIGQAARAAPGEAIAAGFSIAAAFASPPRLRRCCPTRSPRRRPVEARCFDLSLERGRPAHRRFGIGRRKTWRATIRSGQACLFFGGNSLLKLHCKILKALINATPSSRFNKPLELLWISPFPVLLCVALAFSMWPLSCEAFGR
jgi:hypothetical protein